MFKALSEQMAPKERPDLQVPTDYLALKAPKALKDQSVRKVPQAFKDLKVSKAYPASPVHQALQALKANQDQRVLKAL